MKFIGREIELETLENEYKSNSGFVVIYGRRRVGKTTLIKEFIEDKSSLYYLATEEIESRNRKKLSDKLADYTGLTHLKNSSIDNWEDLFEIFASYNKGEKKVLVIDEFQFLVNSNKAFPSIFQSIWDEILKDNNVMVILCGSYISMMISEVLSYSSPLYGRRTAQIKLNPLTYLEVSKENSHLDFKSMVNLYALTGGVPKYLEFFINDNSLYDNMNNVILNKNGFLYEEPVFLLNREVRETMTYFSIMYTISEGNHKLSKIAGYLGYPVTNISPYIRTLIELNLVEKRVPITEKNPEKSRKGLYYISDNFISFWFKFIYKFKDYLELNNRNYVIEKIKANFVDNHVSYIFEDISREITIEKSEELGINISKIGSYWDVNCEIDLLAIDNENKIIIFGECKYHINPVKDNVYYNLVKKVENIKGYEGYKKMYIIYSASGYDKRLLDINDESSNLVLFNCNKIVSSN